MIRRDRYLSQIEPFVGKDVIKVLTGMRRSGKSTLLEAIREELVSAGVPRSSILSMSFESLRWEKVAASCHAFYEEAASFAGEVDGKAYLFFDEVQQVDQWERAVNSLRIDFDCDIYLTGSNSKLLSGELATLLGGRYVTFEVFPFSLRELAQALPDLGRDALFERYRILGGMPFLSSIDYAPESSASYLRDVFNSIVLKDIVQRHGFRNSDQLERILAYFMSEVGTTYSVDNVVNVLRQEKRTISVDSVYNYLQAAEDAMLLTRVKRYDLKGKAVLRGGEKAYLTDVGLREALLGSNESRVELVMENLVFCELRRRGYAVYVGRLGEREIDFVAEKGGKRAYFQVAYLLASEKTLHREFSAFDGIDDNFPKVVVSMDPIDFSRNGIRHCNIVDLLLSEGW